MSLLERRVPGDGPRDARIVVIGEAPGQREDAERKPFVGPSGWRLNEWLTRAGLARSALRVENVCERRPAGNKIEAIPKLELAAWVDDLHDRIAALPDPWVLVPMGNTALRALLGRKDATITSARGFIESYTDRRGRQIKVIPSIHSAATFRTPSWERPCQLDWHRIAADSAFRDLRLPSWEHFVAPTISDGEHYLAHVAARPDAPLSIDIETWTGVVSMVGFACEPAFSFTFPTTLDYWQSPAALAYVWQLIAALCALPNEKVLQTGNYDRYWLRMDHGIRVHNYRWDCHAMHHCLTGDTKVLHADLLWRRLDEAKIGDVLLSFEEEAPRGHRKMKRAVVTAVTSRYARVHEVAFSNGETISGTRDHRFLVGCYERHGRRSGGKWKELHELQRGDEVWSIGKPWTVQTTYDAGWLAGLFDGEGSTSPKLRVSVSQKSGAVLDRAKALLTQYGFRFAEFLSVRANSVSLNGGLPDALRFLGQIRPNRLLARAMRAFEHGVGDAQKLRGAVTVVDIRPVGRRKVYDISTTTQTFIANGILVHNCLDATDDHDLGYMASVDLRCRGWKHMPKDEEAKAAYKDDAVALRTYNGIDNIVQWQLADLYRQRLAARGKMTFYADHYVRLFDPLLDLMLTGIRTDAAQRRERFAAMMAEVRRTRDAAATLAGTPLHAITGKKKIKVGDNISAHKLKAYCYTTLKLPAKIKRDTGKQTVDETALRSLMLKYPAKIGAVGEQVLLHRRAKKISEFVSEARVDADGRMRSSYGFAPETGRLSSSKNPKRGGANGQNQDREIRSIFVPDEGHIFAEFDMSQAEDRIVKTLAASLLPPGPRRDELLWRARSQPWENDEHVRAAVAIFKTTAESVSKAQRYIGKRTRHASNYNQHGNGLSETLLKDGIVIPPVECERMISAVIDEDTPEVRLYQREIRRRVMADRVLVNSWGRELSFEWDRLDDEAYRRGYAFLPQSSVPAILNQRGHVPLYHWLMGRGAKACIVQNGHDSLLISTPPNEAWDIASFLHAAMAQSVQYWGVELTIPIEMKVGRDWSFAGGQEWKRWPTRDEFEAVAGGLA